MSKYIPQLLAALALAGCASSGPVNEMSVPVAVTATQEASGGTSGEAQPSVQGADTDVVRRMQRLTSLNRAPVGAASQDWSTRFSDDDDLRVAVENMPLSQFLHYAFGELLATNYVIAEGIANLDRPVTLNLQEPVSSRRLFVLATELLASRQVGVTYRDEVFYVHPLDRRGKGDVFIGFGARSEDVPDVPGPIMQIIPLRYGLTGSIERTINGLVDAQVIGDVPQGVLFVTGERFEILRVLDVVALLDQPSRRGRNIGLVSLTYVTIEEFMDRIIELLAVEGIPAGVGAGASNSSVALVSLESVGAVVVFATSRQQLDRVEYWAAQVDRPARGAERRYYIYTPRYARADELGRSLVPLLGGDVIADAAAASAPRDTRSALAGEQARSAVNAALEPRRNDDRYGARGASLPTVSVRTEELTMAVDLRSNALIFNTTGTRYQSLLPMIRRLDTPPRQILLEATIAEVSLTDEFAMGVEFALENSEVSLGTAGGLGLPDGGGFISVIGNDGSVRAQLSASNRLVNVLSNPTLVVRDGVSASISVGNDIPTVGATFFDPIQSDTQITSVQYRKTGVTLTVRPTLNAQGLVVMEIEQDISNTVEGGSEVEGAPAIFERSLSTEVIARSGETVILGGLISDNKNETVSSVPGLGRLPLLGRLFRSEIQSAERTELVVMITPRVLDEKTRWGSVMNRLDRALRHLSLENLGPETENSGEDTTN